MLDKDLRKSVKNKEMEKTNRVKCEHGARKRKSEADTMKGQAGRLSLSLAAQQKRSCGFGG